MWTFWQRDNLILKCCEIYEKMCSVHLIRCHKTIQAFIILDLLNVIKLFHILGPAVCFNNSTLSDARLFPCRRCSPLTQADWWEQGAVSCSRTHVSEAALWENSETGTIDYAWRQVTCLVIHNETEIKLLFTPQLRPSLKLEFFFVWAVIWKIQIHILTKCSGTLQYWGKKKRFRMPLEF